MKQTWTACALALMLVGGAAAQEKKKDEAAKPPAIKVCVADIRNVAKRSVSLSLQRDYLIRELNQGKPPKKAADQRRIAAVALVGEAPGGGGISPRDQGCDFVLYTTIAELRDKSDFKTPREQLEDLGQVPLSGNANEPGTFARVDYSLVRSGSPSPVVESSVSARENMTEMPTVQLLMDRIARRVNSAVREAPRDMRE
jgi:hypothetical protein